MNIPCVCRTFHQLPSTFHSCAGHSAIIPCDRGTFHPISSTSVKIMCLWDLLKTFRVVTGPSVNFRQPSVHPRDNLLTICASAGTSMNFVNYLCGRRNFCKLSVQPCDLTSTSINFPSFSGTIRQYSVHQQGLSSTFHAPVGPSLNFPRICGTFCQPPSTFCASTGHSVNFPCIRRNFVNFRQLSVRPLDLPSTFRMAVGSSVHFCQLSVRLWDIL